MNYEPAHGVLSMEKKKMEKRCKLVHSSFDHSVLVKKTELTVILQ